MAHVDVLIPSYERPCALAVTLTSLLGQTVSDIRVVVSDQSESIDPFTLPELQSVVRVFATQGIEVETHRHLPRRGVAENRQFLLDRCRAPYALALDDDVILEPSLVARLLTHITRERCGFVGSAVIGLSYEHDERPFEQHIEFWDGPVRPEKVRPGMKEWERHRLHNACNLLHVHRRFGLSPGESRLYKVAWVGGCVLYDTQALRDVGGYSFHRDLPVEHVGEDVLAQVRVMERYGGCGLLPSGAYHQELKTTVSNRSVDAPIVLLG